MMFAARYMAPGLGPICTIKLVGVHDVLSTEGSSMGQGINAEQG